MCALMVERRNSSSATRDEGEKTVAADSAVVLVSAGCAASTASTTLLRREVVGRADGSVTTMRNDVPLGERGDTLPTRACKSGQTWNLSNNR